MFDVELCDERQRYVICRFGMFYLLHIQKRLFLIGRNYKVSHKVNEIIFGDLISLFCHNKKHVASNDVIECLCRHNEEVKKRILRIFCSHVVNLWPHQIRMIVIASRLFFSENFRARDFFSFDELVNFISFLHFDTINHELFFPFRDHHQFREPRIISVGSLTVLNFKIK